MIYAYAIGDAGVRLPPRPGLGGARLRELTSGRLVVVYSRHRSLRPRPSPDLVLAHERVVESLMDRRPLLPLRFGTMLAGEDELAAAVTARHDELGQALDHVRGRVEMGLRVVSPADPEPRPRAGSSGGHSGRSYLMARAAEHRRIGRLVREVHRPLAELAAAGSVRERPQPPAVLVAAYLVDRDRVADFRTRAATLAAGHDDLQFHVTGPWPPYNFTTGPES